MSKKLPVWYLAGPFYQYVEDVKALAAEAGVRIIDALTTDDRSNEADEVPEVTVKPEYLPKPVEQETGLTIAQIKEKLDAAGIQYDANSKKAELLALLEQ